MYNNFSSGILLTTKKRGDNMREGGRNCCVLAALSEREIERERERERREMCLGDK